MPTPKPAVLYQPRSPAQRHLAEVWGASRLVLLLGPAGTGKTHAALAHALADALAERTRKVLLCRPTVAVDEEIGFLPGTVEDKLGPWLGPFHDVVGEMSHAALDALPVEAVPAGVLRGRTVRDAALVVDEAQNLTARQILCAATRVGRNGKVVLCGDPGQSDLRLAVNPLAAAADRLAAVPGVAVVRFPAADQLRDPFVSLVLAALAPDPA